MDNILYKTIRYRHYPVVALILMSVFLAGCLHSEDGSDVATVQFFPRMLAVVTATEVEFEVIYYNGDDITDPRLVLDPDDQVLVSTNGSMSLDPIDSDLFSKLDSALQEGLPPMSIRLQTSASTYFPEETEPVYRGSIMGDVPGVTFNISLDRVNLQDAPNSIITLPPLVEILAPQPNDAFSRAGDDIVVEWVPTGIDGDSMEIEFDCECPGDDPGTFQQTVSDAIGAYAIPLASLFADLNLTTENCACALELCRTREGTLSSVFVLGGILMAKTVSEFSLIATP